MENSRLENCDYEEDLISNPCYNILLLITVFKVLILNVIIWVGVSLHYNPLIIPSISEIIESNITLKALYISGIIIVQMALILMYWHIEDETFNFENSTTIYMIIILSILQCLGFVLIGIFDVGVFPVEHYWVTGITFAITIFRQVLFHQLKFDTGSQKTQEPALSCNSQGTGWCLCFNCSRCTKKQRLYAILWMDVVHVLMIIGLLIPFAVVTLQSDPPHTTIALCEHLAVYLTAILGFYNVIILSFAKKS